MSRLASQGSTLSTCGSRPFSARPIVYCPPSPFKRIAGQGGTAGSIERFTEEKSGQISLQEAPRAPRKTRDVGRAARAATRARTSHGKPAGSLGQIPDDRDTEKCGSNALEPES